MIWAKPALFVFLLDVGLQRLILEELLFEHKNGLTIETEFAKVELVIVYVVVAKVLQKWKSAGWLPSFARVAAKLATVTYLLPYLRPNILSRKHNSILRILYPLTWIAFTGFFSSFTIDLSNETVIWVICDKHSHRHLLAHGAFLVVKFEPLL